MTQNQSGNTQHQLNNATMGYGTGNMAGEDQAAIITTSTTNESNQVYAANLLQLANGNFVVRNTTFQLSTWVADRMSIQSFKQQANHKGSLWIDSEINVSAIGNSFRMIEETGHFANMTGCWDRTIGIGTGLI
eukprot:15345032-Ditylum_brightwellii.AAC.1